MKEYPVENGIAIPLWQIDLPDSRYGWDKDKYQNNHHNEWSAKKMGQLAVTQCLRDLDRHQYMMPVDVHKWLHDTYGPPEMPTPEQAAQEVVDAYEHGEQFKRYDRYLRAYRYDEIPLEVVDRFVAVYGLKRRIISLPAAD